MYCCQKAIDLLSSGIWKFKSVSDTIYKMEEFDQANHDMDKKPKGYIKALGRCSY
jgi:threonine dehydrogenase-like Zn-dependent dehydrogenase